ncbi:MAG: hypothetical protein ABIL09_23190 [Gemmatimonadota bacterium]
MQTRPFLRRLALPLLAVALGLAACGHDDPAGPLASGVWGGQGVRLDLTDSGGTLTFDCGGGRLLAPLAPDRGGHFRVQGEYLPGQPGPVRQDEVPEPWPAVYAGTVSDGGMALSVYVEGKDAPWATYALRPGEEPLLHLCL